MKPLLILTTTIFILLSVKQTAKFVSLTETSAIANYAQAVEPNIWRQMRENTGYVVLLSHAKTVLGAGDSNYIIS